MDEVINALRMGQVDVILKVLTEYNIRNAQSFSLNEPLDRKKRFLEGLFRVLRDPDMAPLHSICLSTLRIVTRDQADLQLMFPPDRVETLLHLARLVGEEEALMTGSNEEFDSKVVLEAQKCLCNLVYNCVTVQRMCAQNSTVEGVMLRLRMYKDPLLPHEIKYFDMRLLFLLTALAAETRGLVREEYHGLIYIMEVADLILKNSMEPFDETNKLTSTGSVKGKRKSKKGSRRGRMRFFDQQNQNPPKPDSTDTGSGTEGSGHSANEEEVSYSLSDSDVDLACEVLKVLFNLTCNIDRNHLDESDVAHFQRMVSILHDLLLSDTKSVDKKDLLQTHTINLLTNMPPASYEELLTPLTDSDRSSGQTTNECEYEDYNIEAIIVLIEFLERKLDVAKCKSKETLSPILVCLCEASRANRVIRRYLKQRILPPIKDVKHRPEEGITIKSRLVRLMTDPDTDIKELVADLLFILCKENVGRLIKYTGYGNAAGLLANRGLMLGGKGNSNYSSDSDESDTDEYLQYRDKINPVLGCYEDPKPNPLEGMSEEQKEYEAMQLVSMIDKLTREGPVRPCRIGDDGRPVPVESILELRGAQTYKNEGDSDSD